MRLAGLLALGLSASALVACSDDGADAARTFANDLATALEQRDLAPVAVDGDAAAYAALVAPLEAVPVEVEVAGVEADGDSAEVELAWQWRSGEQPWAYATTAELARDGDDWSLRWQPSVLEPSLVEGETLALARLAPRRGEILGAAKQPIVTERDVIRYGLDKTKIEPGQVAGSARRIAQALDIEVAPFVKRAKAAGEKAFVEAITLRAEDAKQSVPASYENIPGAVGIGTTRPLAPTREFALPLLGSVGEATAEIVKESEGAVQAGDLVGLSGLQARYDEQLRGVPGVRISANPADADADADADAETDAAEPRVLHESDPVDGEPLTLTLDVGLQREAEQILAGVGPASAIVAIDPASGDIVAAASGPGSGGQNTATFGRYAPGSTMKVVSSLALLRSGLRPDSMVQCPATLTVDGKSFKNYSDYPASSLGRIPLREAVAQSCNTAFVGQYDTLSDDAMTDAAAALGLGVDHDLGFPAYFGQVPPPAGPTEKAADLIGQGKVLASPMAMATVAASVRAGHAVLPQLVVGHEVTQQDPAEPLSAAEAKQLRALMRGVVTSGSGRFLADLGGDLGAKTGTAEYGEPNAAGDLATHAWMIAQRPGLAVAVFVADGQSGSATAGPLLEAFLTAAR
ncbi:penicillin-binding transpeptidase domain-containing protein [Nocardioides dubius]|uniref:Penicillin-binding transpeptidase domain-containing protein n=1 Tax=Nocardioides dubius TaxID=317019 RepID=A0ABN1TSW3_9ACTN